MKRGRRLKKVTKFYLCYLLVFIVTFLVSLYISEWLLILLGVELVVFEICSKQIKQVEAFHRVKIVQPELDIELSKFQKFIERGIM